MSRRSASLLVVALAVALPGAECEQARLEGLDRGRMLVEAGNGEWVEACPYESPWRVSGEDRWVTMLTEGQPDWFLRDDLACPYDVGVIWVEEGMPWGEDALAEAELGWNRWGQILYCVIVVGPLATEEMVWHEAGHCEGLDDDPSSPDLNSIMSSPTLEGARWTAWDGYLIEEGC